MRAIDWALITIVCVWAALAAAYLIRSKKKGKHSCGDCSSCKNCGACAKKTVKKRFG